MRATFFFAALLVAVSLGNETGYRERACAVAAATTGCAPAQTVSEP